MPPPSNQNQTIKPKPKTNNQTKTKRSNQNQNQRQTHSRKITIRATIGATDDQTNRSTHQSTNPLIQTHRSTNPNPPSTYPSPLIQTQPADPRQSNLQNPKPSTSASFEREKCERGSEQGGAVTCERQREEVRVRMRENNWENKIMFLVYNWVTAWFYI